MSLFRRIPGPVKAALGKAALSAGKVGASAVAKKIAARRSRPGNVSEVVKTDEQKSLERLASLQSRLAQGEGLMTRGRESPILERLRNVQMTSY